MGNLTARNFSVIADLSSDLMSKSDVCQPNNKCRRSGTYDKCASGNRHLHRRNGERILRLPEPEPVSYESAYTCNLKTTPLLIVDNITSYIN
jgi:hypothetical protein